MISALIIIDICLDWPWRSIYGSMHVWRVRSRLMFEPRPTRWCKIWDYHTKEMKWARTFLVECRESWVLLLLLWVAQSELITQKKFDCNISIFSQGCCAWWANSWGWSLLTQSNMGSPYQIQSWEDDNPNNSFYGWGRSARGQNCNNQLWKVRKRLCRELFKQKFY